MERERLGSRLGFILLSAGCAIGCGNVWKFPWMCGQYGGGGFVLIYILCLLLLGLPVMTMEFAVGRAAQASPIHMYQKLERKGQKWHLHGYIAFFGNIALMAFYTVVTGWIIYYFVRFLTGRTEDLGFVTMITNPGVNVTYLAVTVIVAFGILCFNLQGGLERITKYMMTLLMVLMVVLACKELYGKAVKTALELDCTACAFDLGPASELGQNGLFAAAEGVCGGAYRKKFALSGRWEPELACSFPGADAEGEQVQKAWQLARSIMETRDLVNCPANLLRPEMLAQRLKDMADGLPIEAELYDRQALERLGLRGLLTVGDSSAYAPAMVVLRYTGAPDCGRRLGLVGKGVTVDTGGYCLKPASSMAGIKGDMAGGAAAAAALRALAANGVPVNVTVVVPVCENRISDSSMVPGDVITSFSGKTIEILNSDAEGRLILADGLAWAAEREGCTHLVDIATLTGAICAMLGFVTTGVMASDNGFYDCLLCAAERSGEKFWRMPDDAEYETLIESDYADVRNTSKDGCGAITAGLFLKKFTAGRPWLHLDIAGTADNTGIVWQHQVPGATGTAVSTLYHLAQILFETSEEEPA